jgi:alpha-aminoadipic semialdehyde synthase
MLILGIRREDKAREMRAALSPEHVRRLLSSDSRIRVLVERSAARVFEDGAYSAAGAELVDAGSRALDAAHVVLGVKEVPATALRSGQTLCCFAHVIKAQPAGMPLLDALTASGARLVDYEAITEGGTRGSARLVAFGRHAGIAGTIDILRGLGERLLAARGVATPFLGVAATWQYPTLEAAFAAVRVAGEAIARHGLPTSVAPLIIAVTGLRRAAAGGARPAGGGRVACGAREVLELLPLQWVLPADVEALARCAEPAAHARHVYAVALDVEDTVERSDVTAEGPDERADVTNQDAPDDARAGLRVQDAPAAVERAEPPRAPAAAFDRAHFKASPDAYAGTFHRRLAPFVSVLVHCAYWEPRCPRLLTGAQARALAASGALRLLAVSDISCDVGGAVGFMRPTTMGAPFFVHDALADAPVLGDMAAAPACGVLYSAVDHLPSECPRDASEHFGDCLMPLLPPLLDFAARERAARARASAATDAALPPQLRGAVVVENGALAPQWEHVAALRAALARAEASREKRTLADASRPASPLISAAAPAPRSLASPSAGSSDCESSEPSGVTMELKGHIFDTGLINAVLDAIEVAAGSSNVISCDVGRTRDAATRLVLRIFGPPGEASWAAVQLNDLISVVKDLAVKHGAAYRMTGGRARFTLDATAASGGASPSGGFSSREREGAERILVLGAGFVSAPCVDALLRRPSARITVASAVLSEATALASTRAPRVAAVCVDLNTTCDNGALLTLIQAHDIVVSLVPAPLHPIVARACIDARVNMVTSSYVSPALSALHEAAVSAGITIVNECGLDPGIDHMTVAQLIARVKGRGGAVTAFSSVCGGLPSPEAANNPLGYKWSWSPRGALAAMGNGARWLRGGSTQCVAPGALLGAAAPFRLAAFPGFALEVLPNRDSLPYVDAYAAAGAGLADFSRGTLRFEGFSALLGVLVALGALEAVPMPLPPAFTPSTLGAWLCMLAGGVPLERLEPAARKAALAAAALSLVPPPPDSAALNNFFEWLPLDAPAPLFQGPPCDSTTYLPLDTLANCLATHAPMSYATGERDMVVMQHNLRARFPDGSVEVHTSALVAFAESGSTAMARTVGFTAAAAAALILDGNAPTGAGVTTPVTSAWYEPILNVLENKHGIRMVEVARVHHLGLDS